MKASAATPLLVSVSLLCCAVTNAHAQRPQSASNADSARSAAQTNDEMQPVTLPALPPGLTTASIVRGDAIFHGRGGCFACHGAEAQGLPAAGDAITVGLAFVQPDWRAIANLVARGLPDALTRSPIRMPGRGARGDLTDSELYDVAAYVWAISQVHGEPWPGGHTSHDKMLPPGATKGTAGPAHAWNYH